MSDKEIENWIISHMDASHDAVMCDTIFLSNEDLKDNIRAIINSKEIIDFIIEVFMYYERTHNFDYAYALLMTLEKKYTDSMLRSVYYLLLKFSMDVVHKKEKKA